MKPDLKSLFPHASESFIKRNRPHYGVDSIPSKISEPDALPALDHCVQGSEKSQGGVEYRVAIIGLRKRLYDSDNFVSSCKATRDAIAATLGIDDGDPHIHWEYGQVQTNGEQGLLVKIEIR